MCGIVGIFSHSAVNQALYDALTVLQHRGQDAAGIMTCDDDGQLYLRKNNGLVRDVFHTRHMVHLRGNVGIGHVRYPTAGCASSAEAQPFYVNSPYGIALAHNGNLTNAEALKDALYRDDLRHINTDSDSEVLLNVFAHELAVARQAARSPRTISSRPSPACTAAAGARYAAVAMITGYGIVAFRDPVRHPARWCSAGARRAQGAEYMIASESVALDALGFDLVRDVAPGEAVFIIARRPAASRASARTIRTTCPASSSTSISRAPIRSSTTCRCTRPGCAWARNWRRRSAANGRTTTSTWSSRSPIPAAPPRCELANKLGVQVPRRLHQEPLHRPHLHHAGTAAAQEIGAAEAQRHRSGIQRQERAAGRRFHRARHHLAADHPDGARCRRPQGLLRLGGAAGALPERLRHRHAQRGGADRARPRRRGDRAEDRRRLADLPGSRRPDSRQ